MCCLFSLLSACKTFHKFYSSKQLLYFYCSHSYDRAQKNKVTYIYTYVHVKLPMVNRLLTTFYAMTYIGWLVLLYISLKKQPVCNV